MSALSLNSTRELESLITAAIYADLLTATLDPLHGVAIIGAVAPLRDLAPGSVPSLLAQLQMWSARCEATHADLEARIAGVKGDAKLREERRRRAARVAEKEKEKVEDEEGDGFGDGGGARKRGKRSAFAGMMPDVWKKDGDAMDVDDTGSKLAGLLGKGRRARDV